MDINPYKNFIIDYWYKAMLVFCSALLMLALTVDMKVVSNLAMIELALGGVFVSFGEWINHPYQEWLLPSKMGEGFVGKMSHRNRNSSRLGNLFNILGFIFLVLGCVDIYSALHG